MGCAGYVIADDYADKGLGTVPVNISPAHDFNVLAMGKRHGLDFVNVFSEHGKVNENGGMFEGLQRFDARVAVQAELT